MQFYQTRSNVIVLYNTLRAICIEKVVYMNSGEESYNNVYQSPRLPRKSRSQAEFASWTSGSLLISKREHPSTTKAMKAKGTGKPVAKSSGKPEAVTSTLEYKVYHIHSVQKQDDVRRETVKKLIHQFDTHPNRESLMADSVKDQKNQSCSVKS